MTGIDRSPTRLGSRAAVLYAVVSWVAAGLYSWTTLFAGGGGLALFVLGIRRGSRRRLSEGAATLFAAAVIVGSGGAPVGAVLLGVITAVLAWDAGTTALGLGYQLGRDATARRIELVHLARSGAVGALTGALAYGVYTTATVGGSFSALVFLLAAALALVVAARLEPG